MIAVLLGEKENVDGGSGKVIKSGPKDRIFFFYSDHGNENSFRKFLFSHLLMLILLF